MRYLKYITTVLLFTFFLSAANTFAAEGDVVWGIEVGDDLEFSIKTFEWYTTNETTLTEIENFPFREGDTVKISIIDLPENFDQMEDANPLDYLAFYVNGDKLADSQAETLGEVLYIPLCPLSVEDEAEETVSYFEMMEEWYGDVDEITIVNGDKYFEMTYEESDGDYSYKAYQKIYKETGVTVKQTHEWDWTQDDEDNSVTIIVESKSGSGDGGLPIDLPFDAVYGFFALVIVGLTTISFRRR